MFPDEEMFGIDLVVPDVTLPQGEPREGQGVPDHPRPRGPRRRPALRPARVPGRAGLRRARWRAACSATRSRSTGSTTTRCSTLEPGRRAPDRAVHGHPVPDRPLDPGRDGHRPAHAGRDGRPHRRLQVRPHAGRRQAVRLPHPRAARRGGRDLPPVRLDPRREPGLHAVRAHGRRGVPRDHGAARRPGHRRHLRQQHRPRPAGPRCRRRRSDRKVAVIGRSMEQNFRIATDLGYLKYDPA